jgi:hypothetical protein
MSLAANDPLHELSAVPRSKDNPLDRRVDCRRYTAVSRSGLIVVAPIAERFWRIDLRTASRNAPLAFSIRSQRSATWVAWVSAWAAASPYQPPRSRAMTVIS